LERQRLDKWLWHARVVKARTSAAALVEAGHVRVNGVREKAPGHAVKAGDVLTIGLDRSVRVLKVVGFAERRGDASAARALYDDLQDRREFSQHGTAGKWLLEAFCFPCGCRVPALRKPLKTDPFRSLG
jgi:ribosome-associated heat shock protein Hsp15